MKRSDVSELQYIAAIENLASILEKGILSHHLARPLQAKSIANPAVQWRRSKISLPNGKPLHDYANLYLNARNPMMYVCKDQHQNLAVIRIDARVLDLPGVYVADGNAADSETDFWDRDQGLARLSKDEVFAEWWTGWDYKEKKRVRCAEVLVPDKVPIRYISGMYVSCSSTRRTLNFLTMKGVSITINEHLFFL